MNKLAFTLATVAALGLSTAVFAQTSTTASTPQRVQSAQSQTHATKHAKKRHHTATNKVVRKHARGLHQHYASQKSKKVVTKHTPANKLVKTKAAS
jgi:Rod binding domain-containing protein